MKPSSYCTIATDGAMKDLLALVVSMSVNMGGSRLYILADTTTKRFIENDIFPLNLDIRWKISLDKYTGKRRGDMEKDGLWSDFQMEKTNSMLWAFEEGETDVMFLDADIFVLQEIQFDDYKDEEVILSPHSIRKSDEDKYGIYNGGVFWTNRKETIQTWRDHFKGSRFYDQACLEDVARIHTTYKAHDGQNMSWWRIFQGNESPNALVSKFSITNGDIYYRGKKIEFIHTHLYDMKGTVGAFNKLMFELAQECDDVRNCLLLHRFLTGKWSIVLPEQPMSGAWFHTNDSFRELARMWESQGFVKVTTMKDLGNCWFGGPPLCLLYDRPVLKHFQRDPIAQRAKLALFGNPSPPDDVTSFPWIFWARRPSILEEYKDEFRGSPKDHNVIFIGNIENSIQGSYRSEEWGSVVDEFYLTEGSSYKFTHKEYLENIANAKYGLCMRGYGQKCHRETELMGVGTIPLVAPDCDLDSYTNPPVEGVHYFRVKTPEEITNIVKNTAENVRKEMSRNCVKWWEENCSVRGSFRTTLSQIFIHQ